MKNCSKCLLEKSKDSFYRNKAMRDGHDHYCIECRKMILRERDDSKYYLTEKGRAHRRRSNRRQKMKNRPLFIELAKQAARKGCVWCGEDDFEILEFDHINPSEKTYSIHRLLNSATYSLQTLEMELAKCQVLCRNCHTLRTQEQVGSWRINPELEEVVPEFATPMTNAQKSLRFKIRNRNKIRKYVYELLSSSSCEICGEDMWRLLEFDHVNGVKKYNVGDLISKGSYSLETVKREIGKCRILCGNCHRKYTQVVHNTGA